jgi:hypothetical protein
MSPVHIDELNPETRAKVLQQIGETAGVTTTLAIQGSQEIGRVSPEFKDAIKNRVSLPDDELASFIEGAVLTLRLCLPLVDEMKRRFGNLDRSKQVNGKYRTIRGCRTFQEYCKTVLHRTKQAVYAMLSAESKPKEKSPPKQKPVKEYQSLVDAIPVIRAGKEIVPPSQYGVAEIEETVTAFAVNLVSQLKSAADKKIVYASLTRKFEDLLGGL